MQHLNSFWTGHLLTVTKPNVTILHLPVLHNLSLHVRYIYGHHAKRIAIQWTHGNFSSYYKVININIP
jgi:hypothetical protein